MKRKIVFLLMLFVVATIAGCNPETTQLEPIDFSLSAVAVELDRYADTKITVTGSTESVSWSSSDEELVTVNDGFVSAMGRKTGTASVTATIGKISKTCTITITDSGEVPVLEINRSLLEILEEHTLSFTAQVVYKGEVKQANISFENENPEIAAFANGIVSAVSVGTTKINVSAVYKSLTLNETAYVAIKKDAEIRLSHSNAQIATRIVEGEDFITSLELNAAVYNKGTAVNGAQIVWSSSDITIATVTGGIVQSKSPGTVKITASCLVDSVEIAAIADITVIKAYKYLSMVLDIDRTELNTLTPDMTDYADVVEINYDGEIVSEEGIFGIKFKAELLNALIDGMYDIQLHAEDIYYNVALRIFTRFDRLSGEVFEKTMPAEANHISFTDVTGTMDTYEQNIVNCYHQVFRYHSGGKTEDPWTGEYKFWRDMIQYMQFPRLANEYKHIVFSVYVPQAMPLASFRMYVGDYMILIGDTVSNDKVILVNSSGVRSEDLKKGEWFTVIIPHVELPGNKAYPRFGFSTDAYNANIRVADFTMYIADMKLYKEGMLNIEYEPIPVPSFKTINLAAFARTMPRNAELPVGEDNLSWTDVTASSGTDYTQVYKHETTSGISTWSAYLKEWNDMVQITTFESIKSESMYIVFEIFIPVNMPAAEFRLYLGSTIAVFNETSVYSYVTVIDSSGNEVAGVKKGEWLTIVINIPETAAGVRFAFTTNPYNAVIKDSTYTMFIADLRAYKAGDLDIDYTPLS